MKNPKFKLSIISPGGTDRFHEFDNIITALEHAEGYSLEEACSELDINPDNLKIDDTIDIHVDVIIDLCGQEFGINPGENYPNVFYKILSRKEWNYGFI